MLTAVEFNALLCSFAATILLIRCKYILEPFSQLIATVITIVYPYIIYVIARDYVEVFSWCVVLPCFFGLIFMMNLQGEAEEDQGMYIVCLLLIITSLPRGMLSAVMILIGVVEIYLLIGACFC